MSVLVPPGARGGQPDVRGTLAGAARTSSWPLFPGRDDDEDISHKFELLLQLGRGSYGAVYKARVKATGEFVAIKVIQLGEGDKIADIQKEISMLAECNHPNVVRYLGSWRDREKLWIVMEFCGGGSISDLIQAGGNQPLEEEAIAYVCRETLAGLAYLHSIGKVHRDIKAGNILVTEAGAVKVADFGVAAQLTRTISKRNTFIGTPHWMAPEVIQESRYDGKVDVWALGVTAIEMAEAQPPRWRVNPMRVIFMISREPPPQLADLDRWSLPFHDFVAQSLQKDPKARPSAKFLQQHKFVATARQAAAQQLLPRIKACVEMLAAVAEDSAQLLPAPLAEAQELTGRFSWRAQPGPEGATLPARSPWAKTGMARARLAGLSFGAPSPLQPGSRELGGGTVAERPAAASASGTVVIGGSGGSERPSADAGTVVVAGGEAAGGDYLAALRAHARDAGGYAAAVSGAAAAREKDRLAQLPARPPIAKTERERILERLSAVYEGGCVVPIPFLRAADAVPQALLDDVRAPYLPPGAYAPPLGQGTQVPLAAGDWQRAVAELVAEGAAPPRGRDAAGQAQSTPVAQAVIEQVAASPCLLNLCRTLAFHKRTAAEEPLSLEEAEQQQHLVHDLADTLRTILCL